MHLAYAANLDLDLSAEGLPRRQYGTAVLSEFPILRSRNTLLPRPLGGEQRGLLEAVLNVRGVRLRFCEYPLAAQQRRRAARAVAADRRVARRRAWPLVLVGDLNARPEAPELAPLWPRFEDAWTRAGDGAGNTYPAEAPDRRIDYVLVTPDVEVRSAEVLASPASDHLQLVADVTVPGSRVGGGHPASATAARSGRRLTGSTRAARGPVKRAAERRAGMTAVPIASQEELVRSLARVLSAAAAALAAPGACRC